MIPALVMGGTHDPITPARWARWAASGLDGAFLRLFAGQGHNLLVTPDGCGQRMVAAFVDDPAISPNLFCYRQLAPTFVLPE